MKPHVDLYLDTNQYLYYASLLHAGLSALASRGEIELRYCFPGGEEDRRLVADPLAVCLRVWNESDANRRLVSIDLRDKSAVFSEEALKACDLYLKRSYHPPDVEQLPATLAEKVLPFGLNYYCRNEESTARILQTLGFRLALRGLGGFRILYHFLVLPTAAAFEQGPKSVVEPTVVFQTRVWEPHETTGKGDSSINEERVTLIRTLRDAFGDRFRGGLVPTKLALAQFPGEITRHPTRRSRYTRWSKNNLIGVYTRGVHQSTAAKLPEYLAASQCIVAEPPRNGLPAPLREGRNYFSFRTPDECVVACRRLLEDSSLATSMRRANHDYYQSEVEPAAHAMRIVTQLLGK